METAEAIRTYSEMMKLPSFKERFNYLKLEGRVGEETFGFDRYLNQVFYKSPEWQRVRRNVIIRDKGCDLGIDDREIPNGVKIFVHHMNPINLKDIYYRDDYLLNMNYLITTTKQTHDAIHYGTEELLMTGPIVRAPNDTVPWR